MTRRLIALLFGGAAIALVAVGCGGGEETTTASITKSEFIEQADAICSSAEKEIGGRFEKFAQEHNLSQNKPPTEEESEDAANTILIPNIEKQVEQIRELGAPEGEEEQVDEILTSVEGALEQAKEEPAQFIESEGEGAFAEANQKAREYGLKVCGSEGGEESEGGEGGESAEGGGGE